MFTRSGTSRSTGRPSDVERLRDVFDEADAVVVGAGSGLSTAAGHEYGGERFRRLFPDFERRYGFHDMYAGTFYPFPTQEEYWAYMSRHVMANRYSPETSTLYADLVGMLDGVDYFVVTTNVDHCFQRAGVDRKRLYYTQGDYGLFQCSGPCCQETWDNESAIRRMAAEQRDCRVPSGLVPRCPRCGRPARMNLRCDDTFVEDEGWHLAAERYMDYLRRKRGQNVLYLELGVGYNTPSIIKYPFWRMTAENPKATYACVNVGDARVPTEISRRSISIQRDIAEVVSEMVGRRRGPPLQSVSATPAPAERREGFRTGGDSCNPHGRCRRGPRRTAQSARGRASDARDGHGRSRSETGHPRVNRMRDGPVKAYPRGCGFRARNGKGR